MPKPKNCPYMQSNGQCDYQSKLEPCIGLPDCCVSNEPPKRPTYRQLVEALEQTTKVLSIVTFNGWIRDGAVELDAKQAIELVKERISKARGE